LFNNKHAQDLILTTVTTGDKGSCRNPDSCGNEHNWLCSSRFHIMGQLPSLSFKEMSHKAMLIIVRILFLFSTSL
jgi:hypothetical protein